MSRGLIDAPSGTGKTFVAVRLVCEMLRHPSVMRTPANSQDGGGDTGTTQPAGDVLLCCHSRRLQRCTVQEVREYLDSTPAKGTYSCTPLADGMTRVLLNADTDTGEAADKDAPAAAARWLVVCTIDALLLQTGEAAARKFAVAVVDEGQHVFSAQPEPRLEGQHVVPPAEVARVRERLEARLRQPAGAHRLYVFHDPNQATSAAPPAYPEGLQSLAPFDSVIRTPKRVRDMAVPFCGSLERGSEGGADGRVVFHPVHEDVPLGPAVQTRGVAKTASRAGLGDTKAYLENCVNGPAGFTIESETAAAVKVYAVAVAAYLDELQVRGDGDGRGCSRRRASSRWR